MVIMNYINKIGEDQDQEVVEYVRYLDASQLEKTYRKLKNYGERRKRDWFKKESRILTPLK